MSKGKVLFQLTGSIACYKSCALLSRLVQSGYEVEVVASKSALEFVGEATLEGLTGKPVHTDTFERGQYMSHIHLMKWADLVLLSPATANAINKFAAGIGDDLISTLFLAYDFKKPYLIAPAMNSHMFQHPATQASIRKLETWGVKILGTGSGNLACGDIGEGRLLEPEQIFEKIQDALGKVSVSQAPTVRPLDILITSGGTREPIDGVRSISNFSSGRTGVVVAETLAAEGHRVTLLRAKDSVRPATEGHRLTTEAFETFSDLETLLKTQLQSKKFDAVIHLAAVSDFSVASLETDGRTLEASASGKIDSDNSLTIHLKKNPKLVDSIRSLSSNPKIKVVAFKLTNTTSEETRRDAVRKLARHAHPDWIVQNDLSEIDSGGARHLSTIFSGAPEPAAVAHATTKAEMAHEIERLLLSSIERKAES